MRSKLSILCAGLLAASLLAACAGGQESSSSSSLPAQNFTSSESSLPEESASSPASTEGPQTALTSFTALDLEGNPVDQEIFKGHKLTLVNVWGTFCGPCRKELPIFGKLSQAYPEEQFQIVGICGDTVDREGKMLTDIVETAQQLVEESGANYLHIVPEGPLFDSLISTIPAYPTTIFVDENGNWVGQGIIGGADEESWVELIEEKLASIA